MTTPQLLDDLRRDEGLRLEAYPDPLTGSAPWTIGYGHCGREVHPGLIWTPEQAQSALIGDIAATRIGLNTALPWWRHLNDVRQDALVNMAFNLGLHGLLEFHDTLAALDRGAYSVAADDVLASKAAKELPERYGRIANLILKGVRS